MALYQSDGLRISTYANGTPGTAGKGISNIENYYYASTAETLESIPEVGNQAWKKEISDLEKPFNETNKYLWNYELITYTDNSSSDTGRVMIAVYSKDGEEGRGIEGILEFYILTKTNQAPSSLPTDSNNNGWTKSPIPIPTSEDPYLWNYEIVNYTTGNDTTAGPTCIGTYGNSITEVKEYYMATATNVAPTSYTDSRWKETVDEAGQGATKPYLWNYEKTSYSINEDKYTPITLLSASNREIETVTEYYQQLAYNSTSTPSGVTWTDSSHNTNPTIPTGWSTTRATLEAGKIMWNMEVIKYAAVDGEGKNLYVATTPAQVGYAGTNGTDGRTPVKGVDYFDGTDGQDGTSIVWKGEYSQAPSNPENGWAYYNTTAKASYTYNNGTWYQMSVDGVDGQNGTNGTSIIWKGEFSSAPTNPEVNWVYKDTDDKKVYIYNGTGWELMVLDGTDGADGTDGVDGLSVFITYNDSTDTPNSPSGNGTTGGWHTAATNSSVWMSQKVASSATNGEWGTPIKIKGEKGTDGRGISNIQDYFQVTNTNNPPGRYSSGTTIGSNWKTSLSEAQPSALSPYLWNFERTTYTTGSSDFEDTNVTLLSSTPRAIESITEYYAKKGTAAPSWQSDDADHNKAPSTTGWSTSVPSLSQGEELLNCEVIKYTAADKDGKNLYAIVSPATVGYIAKDGDIGIPGAKTEAIRIYYLSNSLTPPSAPAGTSLSNGWTETLQTASSTNKYVYSTTGTKTTTYASATDTTGNRVYNNNWGKVELYRAWPGNNSAVTQENYAIFLQTTKGDTQGLFKNEDNGKVYINAEAIQAGTLQVKKDNNVILSAAFDGNNAGKVIIAGWTATPNALSTSNVGLISSNNITKESLLDSGGTSPIRIYCGEGEIVNAPYVVLDDGSLYATAAKFSGGNVIIDGDVILGGKTVTNTQQSIVEAKMMITQAQQDLSGLNNRVTALENTGGGGDNPDPEEPTDTDDTYARPILDEEIKELITDNNEPIGGGEDFSTYYLYDLDVQYLAQGNSISRDSLEISEGDNQLNNYIDYPIQFTEHSSGITDLWVTINLQYDSDYQITDFYGLFYINDEVSQPVGISFYEIEGYDLVRLHYNFQPQLYGFNVTPNPQLAHTPRILAIQVLQIGG